MKTAVKAIFFSSSLLLTGYVSAMQASAQAIEQVPKIQVVSSGSENPQQKMASEIFTKAFAALSGEAPRDAVSISKVSDRELQLDPLLTRKVFDVGIAWQKPDCTSNRLTKTGVKLCDGFFFSKPIYFVVMRVFVKQSGGGRKQTLADFAGKRMCTNRIDFTWPGAPGNIVRLNSLRDCFEMLQRGEIVGVVGEQGEGTRVLRKLKNSADLVALAAPVKQLTYHAIVAKSHPRARTFVYFINSAMEKLHQSGGYAGIIAKYSENEANSIR